MTSSDQVLLKTIESALADGQPIRQDFGRNERLHIDRPMPFLVVHVGRAREPAARDIVTASSSYLLVSSLQRAKAIVGLVAESMVERFGAFIVLDIGELKRDRLASDADYLPPFEMTLSASSDAGAKAAAAAFSAATEKVHSKFRIPQLARPAIASDPAAKLARLLPKLPVLTLRFAPIYRVPESDNVYPRLHEQLVANLVDSGLQAIAAFTASTKSLAISSHRALGRRAFIDAVSRADKAIDDVAQSFDFLLAVTPINARAAWEEFSDTGFERTPQLLYRPLTMAVDQQKKRLFSVALDHFEDPVLTTLYREKQQELDLQLSLLAARETPRFVELGRALYGPVEPSLLKAAQAILDGTKSERGKGPRDDADVAFVQRRAQAMIEAYVGASPQFDATVEVRDDLPGGMMVSGGRLLIARSTVMAKARVEALLSHEVGVHLLTYFNGSAQGLRLFRSGLAGYEGVQEGLAVLAEYLVGGMTLGRLRLLAARVIGCAAMLDGASFPDCYKTIRAFGLPESSAFNLVLRVYRGGGLAKDAVYLRGLLEVLSHLRSGGSLDPFWMGKIAASHFSIIQELSTRGLLKAPQLVPAFLSHPQAGDRLKKAAAGMSPIDMIGN
ncbi:MAG: flavohemoglobin expression-modulating QEGLA motif protein [Candidatus Devosia phytovorans]|uniref:Flavohemoglobin expression-modulating QEGLA motif protein n=1 Tax=Candidatus Devosia phytovorans TaxID=3121372 RepID=A0AAJ6B295_9HYPH|nr:flavohemoglobin expression-modulating QEGLA motif protein [Devosia sp.]WEK06159.1 MAG: flavohemoglobin expression-modulating QEGLA motif protein [Devosia sp.]